MPDQIVDIPYVGQVAFPDTMTDAEIAKAAHRLHLEGMFPAAAEHVRQQQDAAAGINPAAIAGANVARGVAVRMGEQVATSPNLGRAVSVLSKPAAGAVGRTVGVSGGLPGYVAGEALTSPSVLRAAETGIRAGGGLLARMAASRFAQAVTGLPGLAASMLTLQHGPEAGSPEAESIYARFPELRPRTGRPTLYEQSQK
jgi:hypothetical protein